jgi:hypothetical protein
MNLTNRVVEVLLTTLALAGMFCAVSKNVTPTNNSVTQTKQSVLIADGSDPMPFCRICGRR